MTYKVKIMGYVSSLFSLVNAMCSCKKKKIKVEQVNFFHKTAKG